MLFFFTFCCLLFFSNISLCFFNFQTVFFKKVLILTVKKSVYADGFERVQGGWEKVLPPTPKESNTFPPKNNRVRKCILGIGRLGMAVRGKCFVLA